MAKDMNIEKYAVVELSMAQPIAVPMKGPVQGVATITAKNPVMKFWLDGIRVKYFENLSGISNLPIKFKKIRKNSINKNKLNSID